MGQKNRHSNYSFESEIEGRINNDPDFDLDEYIRQKSQMEANSHLHQPETEDQERSQFKNAVLIFMVFAACFLWVNDWSVSQTWSSIFGSDSGTVTSTVPSAPEITVPEPPAPAPGIGDESGYVNYLLEINQAELDGIYSSPALQAFYQSEVPVSYLSELVEAGYQELSYPAIIAYYNSDVTLEYLNTLSEYGFLSEFSYPEVIAYYNADITLDYLVTLSENGFLTKFSYPEVIAYFNSDVSLDYISSLNDAGYLESFSYPAVIAYFNNGVPVDFLNRLRDNNLLDNMSYPEVISTFNTDN